MSKAESVEQIRKIMPSFNHHPNNFAFLTLNLKSDMESEQSPLRTNPNFYVAKNRAHSVSGIKTYSNKQKLNQIKNLYKPQQNSSTTSARKYLDVISKNRALQRRPLHKDQYYSFISLLENNPQRIQNLQQNKGLFNIKNNNQKSLDSKQFSSIRSRHSRTSSSSSMLAQFIYKQKSVLRKQFNEYHSKVTSEVNQQKQKLNFTFYNSKQKLTKIYHNFYKVEHLQDRKTNLYQNNLKRKVDIEDLMEILRKRDKQKKK